MLSYQNDNKSWRKQNFPNLIFIPKMRFLLEVEEEEEEEERKEEEEWPNALHMTKSDANS